jgi:chromosome segregation ATPase
LKILMKMVAAAAVLRWGLLFTLLLLLNAPAAYPLDAAPQPNPSSSSYADLKKTVQTALDAERKSLSSVETTLQGHDNRSRDMLAELDLNKIQLATFGNLLLAPETRIDDLEKAWLGIRTTTEKLTGWQSELKENLDIAQKLAEQLKEQKKSAEQQLQILNATKNRNSRTLALIGDLETLIRSQAQRSEMLERLQTNTLDLIARVGETRQAFIDLAEKFSLGIQKKNGQAFFREPSTH